MLKFLKRHHITTVLICIFLFFVGFSAFHLSFHSPSTSCLLIPPHPSSPRLLSPPPLCSHHFHWHPTLKVQFALRALQKDGTHRVQIVIAVTAQRPSACLCDLEWTSRATDVRQMPLSGTDPAESAPSRAQAAEKAWPEPAATSGAPCLCQGPCLTVAKQTTG